MTEVGGEARGWEVLHHQPGVVPHAYDAVDCDDVGMVDPPGYVGFSFEGGPDVTGNRVGPFESDLPALDEVVGEPDDAHTA